MIPLRGVVVEGVAVIGDIRLSVRQSGDGAPDGLSADRSRISHRSRFGDHEIRRLLHCIHPMIRPRHALPVGERQGVDADQVARAAVVLPCLAHTDVKRRRAEGRVGHQQRGQVAQHEATVALIDGPGAHSPRRRQPEVERVLQRPADGRRPVRMAGAGEADGAAPHVQVVPRQIRLEIIAGEVAHHRHAGGRVPTHRHVVVSDVAGVVREEAVHSRMPDAQIVDDRGTGGRERRGEEGVVELVAGVQPQEPVGEAGRSPIGLVVVELHHGRSQAGVGVAADGCVVRRSQDEVEAVWRGTAPCDAVTHRVGRVLQPDPMPAHALAVPPAGARRVKTGASIQRGAAVAPDRDA